MEVGKARMPKVREEEQIDNMETMVLVERTAKKE